MLAGQIIDLIIHSEPSVDEQILHILLIHSKNLHLFFVFAILD